MDDADVERLLVEHGILTREALSQAKARLPAHGPLAAGLLQLGLVNELQLATVGISVFLPAPPTDATQWQGAPQAGPPQPMPLGDATQWQGAPQAGAPQPMPLGDATQWQGAPQAGAPQPVPLGDATQWPGAAQGGPPQPVPLGDATQWPGAAKGGTPQPAALPPPGDLTAWGSPGSIPEQAPDDRTHWAGSVAEPVAPAAPVGDVTRWAGGPGPPPAAPVPNATLWDEGRASQTFADPDSTGWADPGAAPARARVKLPQGSDEAGQLGDFEILRELGRGGMGAVYLARDPAADRNVALKVILGDVSQVARQRFLREGEVAARLSHPGIVRVYSAGEVEGFPYLAYELVEGARSFKDVSPTLELPERLEMIRDAARALGYAHLQGVTHRDVKPDNMLIDQANNVRVTDFGLGVTADAARLTQTGVQLGTPSFMAPEQVDGDRERQGAPTDVWALGVMLYEALTGVRPFVGQTMPELYKAIVEAEPRPPHDVDASLDPVWDAVVGKALQYESSERYRNGEALARDIERALAGEPISASSVSPWRRRWRRWRKVAIPLVVLAIGALVLILSDPLSTLGGGGSVDLDPPVLTLTSLAGDQVETRHPQLTLEGIVEDASEWVVVEVDGDLHRIKPFEGFSISLALGSGKNYVTVRVVDAAGNRSKARRLTITCTLPNWYLKLSESDQPPRPLPPGLRVSEDVGEYVWENDGSVLVWVMPGSFRLGWAREKAPIADLAAMQRLKAGGDRGTFEQDVTLTRGYWIGKYEVSWAQYMAFTAEAGAVVPGRMLNLRVVEGAVPGENDWFYDGPRFDPPDDYPIHNMSWNAAQAYCTWAGLRLPTEAEWEFAARGNTGNMYPWGDESVEGRCNRLGTGDGYLYTAPVDAFPESVSPAGCFNMAGNVAEWVSDWYAPFPDTPGVDPRGPEGPPRFGKKGKGPFKVAKGGHWTLSWAPTFTTYDRIAQKPNKGNLRFGFRVCLSPVGDSAEGR